MPRLKPHETRVFGSVQIKKRLKEMFDWDVPRQTIIEVLRNPVERYNEHGLTWKIVCLMRKLHERDKLGGVKIQELLYRQYALTFSLSTVNNVIRYKTWRKRRFDRQTAALVKSWYVPSKMLGRGINNFKKKVVETT